MIGAASSVFCKHDPVKYETPQPGAILSHVGVTDQAEIHLNPIVPVGQVNERLPGMGLAGMQWIQLLPARWLGVWT